MAEITSIEGYGGKLRVTVAGARSEAEGARVAKAAAGGGWVAAKVVRRGSAAGTGGAALAVYEFKARNA